jgi:hypothetical protein
MDILWLEAVMVAGAVVLWMQRRKAANREVDRRVERGGLPADGVYVEAAQLWFRRRQETVIIGVLIAALMAIVVLVLSRWIAGTPLLSGRDFDLRLLTWIVAPMAGAVGFASLFHGYRAVRASRTDEPRTAALRPRQLTDYLSPFELALYYAAVVLPLVDAGLGIVVLGRTDHPGRGWFLVTTGLAGVLLWAVGLVILRMALRVNQSSSGQDELRWQEAFRATILRDIGTAMYTVSFLLGTAPLMAIDWPSDIPGWVPTFATVLFAVSVLAWCTTWLLADSKSGLRRVQRVAG